ncbi:MAG: glyoxylase-like metal-dependent hydrolase (beta-lactamase superfamily II) [Cocleimonas sp.]|jgi:glyoxylase-like metal-dependent hydrolase (beta-lactamase superfamily II)
MKINKTLIAFATTAVFFSNNLANANEPVWDGNKVIMTSEKMADGVFTYFPEGAAEMQKQGKPVATSGGIIIGEKGSLIIDTMLNKRLNQQIQDIVKAKTDKPILYAVNTSAHGDHSYGNMYLPKETVVIQHSHAQKYVSSNFKADTEFMMQNFGKGRGIEEITPDTGDILVEKNSKIRIDLGGKFVDIIDFGFAQTGGDLFVWEADSKVLWAGNAIITSKPALPWLLDGHLVETLATLQEVYDFLPQDARIVPGHGYVIGREDIKWHIDYLATIKKQVQVAIDEGLTLEQTVKKVTMPEFGGYALFAWVHPSLNVPAAYKDLSK